MTTELTLPDGLLDRITLIEIRAAIADVVHGYARAIRHSRPADAAALFTEDGIFETRDGLPGQTDAVVRFRHEGRAQFLAYLTKGDGASVTMCPMIHNLMIDVDGQTARASSVMMGQALGTSHITLGEYQDSFRYEGKWLFSSRRSSMMTRTRSFGTCRHCSADAPRRSSSMA